MKTQKNRGLKFLAWLATAHLAWGCGLDWSVPKTYFEGVDEQGYVCYVKQIGELDLGGETVLPIISSFKSDRETSSPYLGHGWTLALLDSNIVQQDENRFLWLQPDGWYRTLFRTASTETVLDGGSGWKAEINGDTITIWASCGWKLKYFRGKLQEMEIKQGRTLSYRYEGNRCTGIMEKGLPVLTIELYMDGAQALLFNGKTLGLRQDKRPLVQSLMKQNLIQGFARSLSSVSMPDDTIEKYEFGIDSKTNPTLLIQKADRAERKFTWDPETRKIKTDNKWNYTITLGNSPGEMEVARRNDKNQMESHAVSPAKGMIAKMGMDGVKNITYRFTGGSALSGRIRKIEKVANGKTEISYSAVYDETGRLLRETDEKGLITAHNFDPATGIETVTKEGTLVLQRTFKNGILSDERYANGTVCEYLAGGLMKKSSKDSSGKTEVDEYQNGRLQKKIYPDGLWQTYNYDSSGKMTGMQDSQGRVVRYVDKITTSGIQMKSVYSGEILKTQMVEIPEKGMRFQVSYAADKTISRVFSLDAKRKISLKDIQPYVAELLQVK